MQTEAKFAPERLEEIIETRGIRKKWIAEKMAIHPQTLYSYLNGSKVPSTAMLRLMAMVLEVSEDELKAS